MGINHVDSTCHDQLHRIAKLLGKAKKIVVVTGAGISTACGIPDFRSTNGLYSIITAEHDAKLASKNSKTRPPKGKELFDSTIWNDDLRASTFYTFIASLRRKIRQDVDKPSKAHKFIRQLRDRRKLVRCYTQNIDGLEAREGLSVDLTKGKGESRRFSARSSNSFGPRSSPVDGGCEVVQLHGDLAVLRCNLCFGHCAWDEETLLRGEAPSCGRCLEQDRYRRSHGRRGTKVGTLRPNIVLYGESHPDADMLSTITEYDLSLSVDILLILGTSLQVHGLKNMVREFAKSVHAKKRGQGRVIFVNLTGPAQSIWKDVIDDWIEMDCDAWVEDLKMRQPDLFLQQCLLAPKVVKRSKVQQVVKKELLDTVGKENMKPASEDVETDEVYTKPGLGHGLGPEQWSRIKIRITTDPLAPVLNPPTPEPPVRQLQRTPQKKIHPSGTPPPLQLPTPAATHPSPSPSSPAIRKRKRNALHDATAAPDISAPRWKRMKREVGGSNGAGAGVGVEIGAELESGNEIQIFDGEAAFLVGRARRGL